MLSDALARRGHETTWFTSSFNHYSRKHRPVGRFEPVPNLSVEVLSAPGYEKNISLKRVLHNHRFGVSFRQAAMAAVERPDVIIADLPTTEAASTAVAFGRLVGIPTIVTIRDLWPDFFSDFAPKLLKPLVRLGLWHLEAQSRFACHHATSLVGISQGYLDWGQKRGGRVDPLDRIFYLGYPRPSIAPLAERERLLAQFNIPPTSYVVSFVGSWGATYDLSLVLEAARLLEGNESVTVVVAGDQGKNPDLADAFRRLTNVRLMGWLDKHQVSALLGRSTVGLLPYAANAPQGLPNKIFEYMAYGLFQVATLPGEARQLLEETCTGAFAPAGAAVDFAHSIDGAIKREAHDDRRLERQAVFEQRFEAGQLYDAFIDHAEAVVHQWRLRTTSPQTR
ncbi:glycosyltransferase [Rhizobium rhizophilum]|nr:glycosyltransferase [Rhizobium rhizophilum]